VFLYEELGWIAMWCDFLDRLTEIKGLGAFIYSR